MSDSQHCADFLSLSPWSCCSSLLGASGPLHYCYTPAVIAAASVDAATAATSADVTVAAVTIVVRLCRASVQYYNAVYLCGIGFYEHNKCPNKQARKRIFI